MSDLQPGDLCRIKRVDSPYWKPRSMDKYNGLVVALVTIEELPYITPKLKPFWRVSGITPVGVLVSHLVLEKIPPEELAIDRVTEGLIDA